MGKKAVIIGADGQMNGLLAEAIIQKGIAAVTLTGKGSPGRSAASIIRTLRRKR